jgi:hypothetical protein
MELQLPPGYGLWVRPYWHFVSQHFFIGASLLLIIDEETHN